MFYNYLKMSIIALLLTIVTASCQKDDEGDGDQQPTTQSRTAGLDNLDLSAGSYDNGSDKNGTVDSSESYGSMNVYYTKAIESGDWGFINVYNATWSSWGGFAASTVLDKATPGMVNQYATYAGSGANGTPVFAVGYSPAWARLSDTSTTKTVSSIMICNTTYAGLSMKNGDDYAKKFGGDSGDDEDWFLLTITGYDENRNQTGTVEFYLADYRFSDNTQDYIVDEWTEVDLGRLGKVAQLKFSLTSSDMGDYGMNTPAYFCADELKYE